MPKILAEMQAGISKRGEWDLPVWLIWSLIALVVLLLIIGLGSGKLGEMIGKLGEVLRQS